MKKPKYAVLLPGLLVALFSSLSHASVIDDDFEVDTSGDYTVADDGTPDGTVTFNFDYIAAGIPLAPRSDPNDRSGLRFTANDTAGASDSFTAYHNTALGSGPYRLVVDMYINVGATSGTTEYGTFGLAASDPNIPNTIFLPISGSGTFLSVTGEGGSASDYRYFVDGTTTVPAADPSYIAGGTNGTLPFYQALYPSPPYDFAGSPGNAWATVEVIVAANGRVIYKMDGTKIIDTNLSPGVSALTDASGLAALGYHDVFSSVATPAGSNFGVFDNLKVFNTPEPTSLLMAGFGTLGLLIRRRK